MPRISLNLTIRDLNSLGKDFESRINATGTYNTTYYYANNELLARRDSDGSMYYYHNDHLGGTHIVTDSNTMIVERTRYRPFGGIIEGGASRNQFTGQEYDKNTGLNYYGARYYNAELRRFTQPDTIIQNPYDPQNLNRYSYTINNPLVYIDPTGNVYWKGLWRGIEGISTGAYGVYSFGKAFTVCSISTPLGGGAPTAVVATYSAYGLVDEAYEFWVSLDVARESILAPDEGESGAEEAAKRIDALWSQRHLSSAAVYDYRLSKGDTDPTEEAERIANLNDALFAVPVPVAPITTYDLGASALSFSTVINDDEYWGEQLKTAWENAQSLLSTDEEKKGHSKQPTRKYSTGRTANRRR